MITYEVQGRRTERGSGGRVVREHVRLASTANREAAFAIAATMVAEEFKAWVFETEQRSGRKSYALLGVLP
jgi:hypothetical protein